MKCILQNISAMASMPVAIIKGIKIAHYYHDTGKAKRQTDTINGCIPKVLPIDLWSAIGFHKNFRTFRV